MSQQGAPISPAKTAHHSGIGAARTRSVHRFEHGIDGIVGVLGPLLLTVLIIAAILGVGALGYRGVRNATH